MKVYQANWMVTEHLLKDQAPWNSTGSLSGAEMLSQRVRQFFKSSSSRRQQWRETLYHLKRADSDVWKLYPRQDLMLLYSVLMVNRKRCEGTEVETCLRHKLKSTGNVNADQNTNGPGWEWWSEQGSRDIGLPHTPGLTKERNGELSRSCEEKNV